MKSIKKYKVKAFLCYHFTKKQACVSGRVHMCSSESGIPFDTVVIESHSLVHSSIHSCFFFSLLLMFGKYFFLST